MQPQIFKNNGLVHGILSKPIAKDGNKKIVITPLLIKGERLFQFTKTFQNKAFHSNYTEKEAELELANFLSEFKEAHFYTEEADFLGLKEKTGQWRWIKSRPTKTLEQKPHNRLKKYLLNEKAHSEFWKALGIAGASGNIKPDKQAKFRQVNRFVEIIADVIPFLKNRPLRIVDFGCGKAYLSFALYHYLVNTLGLSVEMTGIDLKADVVEHLEKIRKEIKFNHLKFFTGNIQTFSLPKEPLDMIISLHACDTATDHVIARGIEHSAKVILAVPCCQHDLNDKIKQPELNLLLKHPILKERFSALATDALRAALLEKSGYQTQVLEFIDTEHTPKNLLIKAIKRENLSIKGPGEYEAFLSYLNLR